MGQTLPDAAWERRHRWMLVFLAAQMAALAAYSRLQGYGLGHIGLDLLPVLAATLLASVPKLPQRARSVFAAFAMLTASAVAVHISGGLIEAHFYFFVLIVVLSLYEDWLPFLLAIGYVVVHHGLLGTLDPSGVYAIGSPGFTDPWGAALIHGGFIAAAGTASVVAWRLNEDVRVAAHRSQEQFQRSFEEAPIGMALSTAGGRLVAVNRSLCGILGYDKDALIGRNLRDFVHPKDAEASEEALHSLEAERSVELSLEKRFLNSDGETVWASVHISNLADAGDSDAQAIVQMQDVTGRKRADREAAVRLSQQQALLKLGRIALSAERLEELLRTAMALVSDSLQTGDVRVIEYHRPRDGAPFESALTLTGHDEGAGISLSPAEQAVAAGEEVAESGDAIAAAISDQEGQAFGILSISCPERSLSRQDFGFVQAVAHVLSGAVQRQRSEDELRHQSLHDPLVGLPNRTLLLDRVGRALRQTRGPERQAAVIFIDLDRFKLVNDSLGHDTGDLLLQTLVPRLAGVLRESDTLSRFGGDEFVVLCEDLDDNTQALYLAKRLHEAFKIPFCLGDQEHLISASIGVAVSSDKYRGRPEELVRDADAAMYRAKAAGGNRIELFDEVLRARILHRLEIESGLRLAIANGELALHYQPIVDLASGEIGRCEALVRWQHRQRGLIQPDEFVPIAEETGLILPLGSWVIEEACRQMGEWSKSDSPELAQMSVAINLSALQMVQEGLVPMISAMLRRHGVDPQRLICEITETALIHSPEAAEQALVGLDALGVGVALADFGTGYSSLASLKQFRLSAIKLDRTFIRDMTPGSRDAKIIGSLVTMAESLGLGVVAEGVETTAQCEQLRAMGCEVAQGFLFGHPVEANVFGASFEQLRSVS
jgi:diguanylate cyclase (GGDEF)-like protein/PAS domain S-box-containing protein